MNVWKYLGLAAEVAHLKEDRRTYQLGAVGLRSDGVLVAASNGAVKKTGNDGWDGHAEARLLRKLDKHAVVFVARYTREGNYRMARPCERCAAALRARRVDRVYYSVAPGEYGVMTFR